MVKDRGVFGRESRIINFVHHCKSNYLSVCLKFEIIIRKRYKTRMEFVKFAVFTASLP